MEIHQFHQSFACEDAIGNEMVEIQKTLKKWGYESNIYSQNRSQGTPPSKNYKEYMKNSSPDNILIVHYSIGYEDDVLSFIESLQDKKFLIYHNITPSKFFTDIDDQCQHYTKVGREQLKRLSKVIDYAVGDSEYNRQELVEFGFKNTSVLPVMMDFAKYHINDNNLKKNVGSTNILFVGRVAPNKRQDDIIKTFYYYKKINQNSKLYIVGSYEGLEKYYDKLVCLVKSLKLDDVYFTGKISLDELISYYRSADVFLCMSEHEGFCVPLIESMLFDVPIVAFGSTAIPYTLGDAGILINKKRHVDIAELINLVVEDKKFREQIIKKQRVRLKDFDRESNEKTLRIQLDNIINNDVSLKKTIRIEGTFEDSYSLSIINRNLALALDTIPIFDVSLCVPKMSDDYVPNMKIIKDAKVVELYTKKFDMPDFVIRNVYPPRICDMKGRNNLIYFYWEESRIPKQWTNDFNRLDAILVPSSFVKKVLIDSGVKTQIFVIQNGLNQDILDIDPRKPPEIMTQKKYKFLNISSGFPRKGIDILLNVFSRAFTKDDDVCLILKTFPNIHNNISKLIDDIKATNINCPEIIHIDRDLDENGIAWLYSNSNCLVYPTRGEGFGMSIAEAMLFKIPVIATGHSGHMDFCNEDNCFLIDYKLEPSRTHLKKEWKIGNSSWAEPDSEHLKYLMRFVYENRDKDVVRVKTEEAENTVKKLTWKRTSDDIRNVLNILDKKKKVNLGIVSTFNVRCGIAEYTKYLAENLDSKIRVEILADAEHENINSRKKSRIKVIICWNKFIKDDLEGLYAQIKNDKLTIVHFQFNFGFFRLDVLMDLIKTLRNDSIKTILTFHAVEDSGGVVSLEDYKDDLKYVDRILVHTQNDRKFLSTLGIEKNVICIPHGIMRFPENGKTDSVSILNNSIIISSFGFLLPHKGVLEIIESLPILQEIYPDIIYLAINATYPVDTSKEYFEKCKKRAEELGLGKKVIFFKEFLREEEIIEIIKLSDIVVMPYKDTKESSSAAIRFALSSCRPIIATNLHIFDEFRSEVFTIEKCSPESIAKGIIDLKNNVELQEKLVFNMKKKVDTYSWSNIAKYYEEMLVNICI